MNKTLKERAPRIIVHDVAEPPDDDKEGSNRAAAAFEIDWESVKP
jgi:hypothetical protein